MSAFAVAVDWGTSSFRLWLIDRAGEVVAGSRGDEGMVKARETGFPVVLERHLAAVGAADDLPVIVCGMAGARQGWREAAYLDAPASLDALVDGSIPVGDGNRDIRILPGICQRDAQWPEVMRGEETQLLGALEGGLSSGLVCMPGTHSKWVDLADGHVRRFATFMTGDVYAALAGHTILRFSIEQQPAARPDDTAFLQAAIEASEHPERVLGGLFGIRAGGLLGLIAPETTPARLSGLLIGGEIGAARLRLGQEGAVTLIGSGALGGLYRAAFDAIGVAVEVIDAEAAVRAGLLRAARRLWGEPA